jgi:hypothetical protein
LTVPVAARALAVAGKPASMVAIAATAMPTNLIRLRVVRKFLIVVLSRGRGEALAERGCTGVAPKVASGGASRSL